MAADKADNRRGRIGRIEDMERNRIDSTEGARIDIKGTFLRKRV
jgi:hypothetical protein